MASPTDSLATYIATDLGLGVLGGYGVGTFGSGVYGEPAVFKDWMPDAADGSLDLCIVVYTRAGQQPALTLGDDTDYPGFEIACRAPTNTAALANDLVIFQALHGVYETDIQGTHFKLLQAIQSAPVPLGRDERQRFVYSRSYRAMVRGVSR